MADPQMICPACGGPCVAVTTYAERTERVETRGCEAGHTWTRRYAREPKTHAWRSVPPAPEAA